MGDLFNKYSLSEYINICRYQLNQDIENLEILETSDIETIVRRLITKSTIVPIEIQSIEPSEPKEISIQSKNCFGDNCNQKAYEINVAITFTGNYELFECSPSTSTIVYLGKDVVINKNTIKARIVIIKLDEKEYNSALSSIVKKLNSNLPRIQAEIKPWNDELDNLTAKCLKKEKILLRKSIILWSRSD